MKNTLYFIFFLHLALLSNCTKETFADVYKEMQIKVIGQNQLFADSNSRAIVEVTFKDNLLKDQEVKITTTDGLLLAPPFNGMGAKEVTLKPFNDSLEVLLISNSLQPNESVFITATIDDYSIYEEIAFQTAFPTDMQLTASKQILDSSDQNIEISAELFRNQGKSSDGLWFDVAAALVESDTTQLPLKWQLPEFVFSSNNTVKIPLTILQHSVGSELEVSVSTQSATGAILKKSIPILFQ